MTNKDTADLKEVLFPVELQPVFLQFEDQPRLFDDGGNPKSKKYQPISRFRAVVDTERNYTFAVVSESYRLVTNRFAVKLGRECFRQVFSEASAEGMEVFNIIMPSTRSFCHIDFTHRERAVYPWEGESWGPYLRVTNSYNRTKPLRFDLGFCRWICKNGVIFDEESIRFRYYHTQDQIAAEPEFIFNFGKLKDMEVRFLERLHNLKRYYVPEELMLALACKVFGVQVGPKDMENSHKRERLEEFRSRVAQLTRKYFSEFGPNGYAALNVITDFGSHPVSYISSESMIDPLQKRTGDWVTKFLAAIQDPSFDYTAYLGEFKASSEALCA